MRKYNLQVLPANVNVTLGDNTTTHINKKVNLSMRPEGSRDPAQTSTFYLQNDADLILGYEALIGLRSLKQFTLDIKFIGNEAKMYYQGYQISQEIRACQALLGSVKVDQRHASVTSDPVLTRLLARYKSVFSDIGPEPLRGAPMRILTVHNRPIFAKQRHYNLDEITQMKKHIQGLLEKGIIEETYSGYAATSRIIPKRNGTGRLVINYIPLNSVTLRDSYALPHVSDILSALQGKSYFSTLDCSQGFYQVLVDKRDRHKTAFSTPIGNYQFVRCPFGARNSCAKFQSEMNRIFHNGLYSRCVIYVDDILVLGESREDHDRNLEWVFDRCRQYNVKLKIEKCKLAQREVDYLGFRVSGQSISPLKERVATLRSDRPPRSKTELKSVIGKLNFYSRFIANYSSMLEPLRELFRKNKDFQWLPNHQIVYEKLISALNDARPQHWVPRSAFKIIELHVMRDTLEVLCLTQDEKLICRSSRFLGPAESNYSLVEKQLLALSLAIDKFKVWLHPENMSIRVSSNGIARALELKERPERIEKLLMRIPDGFDTYKFEIKEGLLNQIEVRYKTHIPEEIYFVDGACKANGKPDCKASWAVVAQYDENINACGFVEHNPSNQSAELSAAIEACKIAKLRCQKEITIVTDSKYLHSAATDWTDRWKANDWKDHRNKPVVHTDLFKQLLNAKTGIQIEWIHVKGHSGVHGNVRADSLARSLLDEQEEALNALMTAPSRMQVDDPEMQVIRKQIEQNERDDLVIEHGIVYYVDPKIEIDDPRRMYVPTLTRPWLLQLAHDNHLYGGHLGIKKTFSKLTRFYWPGMLKDVDIYVKSCHVCQSFKNRAGIPPGYLHSIPVSKAFEHLHLDIVGPTISTTKRGNRYIITATDAFSKYAFAKPCQSIKTLDLIKFVEDNIMFTHGKPEVIITDRGSQFTSSEWEKYTRTHAIKHQLTSSYHPQSNGIDERLNGTLVRILRSYVDEFQEMWDVRLRGALYVYNTTVHSSTGFSPYHILHGLDPRSPFNEHVQSDSNLEILSQVREFIRRKADELNKQAQASQKREYDRRHREANLRVGQFVWVREHACPTDVSKKFYPKWYGPCVVISVIGDEDNPKAVSILDLEQRARKVVAIQDVKPHHERPDNLSNILNKYNAKEGEVQPDGSMEIDHESPLIQLDDIPCGADKPSSRLTEKRDESPDHHAFQSHDESIAKSTSDMNPSTSLHEASANSQDTNNFVSSSPRRRVTFSDQTQIFLPDASSIHFPDDTREEPPFSPPPNKDNPYVMEFIIDNPTTDPDFDPEAQNDASSSDTISPGETTTESRDHSSTAPPQQAIVPTAPVSGYRLRPLPGRSVANIPAENQPVQQDNNDASQTSSNASDVSAVDSLNDDLIPPEVDELDEETLIDINAVLRELIRTTSIV